MLSSARSQAWSAGELEEFDRVGEDVLLHGQVFKGVEYDGEEDALRLFLVPPSHPEGAAIEQPLLRQREDVLVRRNEDTSDAGGVLEEGCVLRPLPEFLGGVLDVPASLPETSDDGTIDVLVGEEREAAGHYRRPELRLKCSARSASSSAAALRESSKYASISSRWS